ncbi:MAG: hypothetical protein FWC91_08025 [Defluviitaleaceae bacterium]|nr:hypothetical protein [Defluviitaleaceae bacterium]
MIVQSNPVLFILCGQTMAMQQPLMRIFADYGLKSVAFIAPEAMPKEKWLKNEINRVQQEFIKQSYNSSGIIRINYLLSGDSWDIPALRENIERYISMLYPAEIYTDIYWTLDDASALDGRTPNRIKTMSMLREILSSGTSNEKNDKIPQVYLMSNLDSGNAPITMDEILRTIALLVLFKDYEPKEYPVAPDASLYNEFIFAENASEYHNGPGFWTAGIRSLHVPVESLKKLLTATLLNWEKNRDETPPLPNFERYIHSEFASFSKIVDQEYIYGLAIPDVNKENYNGFIREDVIEKLFGERLNDVLQMYDSKSVYLPDISNLKQTIEDLPFYCALDFLGDGGEWRTATDKVLSENKETLEYCVNDLKKWLATEHKTDAESRRRLSLLVQTDAWPYHLAEEYVERLFKINALQTLDNHLEQILAIINDCYDSLLQHLETVNQEKNELTEAVTELNNTFEPFIPCVSEYFLDLFEKYADSHEKELRALTSPLAKHLRNDSFSDHIAQIEDFIERKLMPNLEQSFTMLLSHLTASGKRFPVLFADWAMSRRHLNIQLNTGYVGLYTEANVFMPNFKASEIKSSYESQGIDRMNFFVDSKAQRIDVLYHAGTFNLDDLYYKELYV